jgi:outer membrane protein insertion porin family/translocation and assembly module TamA
MGLRRASTLLALLGVSSLGQGCASKPAQRATVEAIQIQQARQIPPDEILARIATRANATLLGFALQYETYDRFVLERDIQRIERYYQSRGFFDARVRAGRVERTSGGDVRIEILVEEGTRTTLAGLRVLPNQPLSPDAALAVARVLARSPRVGDPFEEEPFEQLRRDLQRTLADHGYARASIVGGFSEEDLRPASPAPITPRGPGKPERRYGVKIDPIGHQADIFLRIEPGPICVFGPIALEGLGDLPERRIRGTLGLREGETFSVERLEEGRQALLELGVFSSVEYSSDPEETEGVAIPVRFKLTPAPLRTVTMGGGLQADMLQTDVHFFAGYEHQNFLGGLRRLSAQLRPGAVLFPTNLQNLLPPERALPDVRARVELKQPQLFGLRTRGTLRSEFLVYPFLLPARNSAEVPDVVVGYREIRQAAGLDRSFFGGKVTLSGFYNVQLSYPFSYVGPLDEGIRSVTVSYLSAVQALDLRDNPIRPRLGVFLTNELQVAGLPTDWMFQSDARDIKIQPDVRFYVPVSRKLVVATRMSLGFLFPSSYGATLEQESPDRTIDPIGALRFEEKRNRDLQLLFFRAFFSGGPTSNRGYPLRGVGPRGIAPFRLGGATALRDCVGRVPAGAGVSGAASRVARLPEVNPEVCSVALGGLSLWEWSGELRYAINDLIGTLVFLDASDVTRQRLALRLDYPHITVGTGLRLSTPVGPVRLDVGWAVPRLQRIGGALDPSTEGRPATFLGQPVALNIAVGEAF